MNRTLTILSTVMFLVGTALATFWSTALPPTPAPGQAPQRLISMSPNVTETLFALGAGERVVGVTQFCQYPPEARSRETLGGFINPNLERLLALRPDLVIVHGQAERIVRFCGERGIPLLRLEMEDLDSIRAGIQTIAETIGAAPAAERINKRISTAINEVTAAAPSDNRPNVFLCFGHQPGNLQQLYSAGRDTFLHEIVTLAGGHNLFADSPIPYPHVSKEFLLEHPPDLILDMQPSSIPPSDERRARLVADWGALGDVPAVSNGRVEVVTETYAVMPGPRVDQLLRHVARVVRKARGDS